MFYGLIKRIRRITASRTVILMYHQICERADDPWELAVHPDHFDAQLTWLRKNFEVLPVEEVVQNIGKRRTRKSVAITFDDGFKDNYTNAAPLLDWHGVPATFYLATSALRQGYVYWWDALQDVIFHSEVLPRTFEMLIGDTPVRFIFSTDDVLDSRLVNEMRVWNFTLPIPNERVALYMLLWHRIKPLDYATQESVIKRIRGWAGHTRFISEQSATMNIREMQMLGENPLFSIGAHSVHHCMLSQQNAIEQSFEIKESKRQLESWLGKVVAGFAYPYGNYNGTTQSLLRDAGFDYAVSTESKPVSIEDDRLALPRIQVKNWCVYEFASKLNEMVNE